MKIIQGNLSSPTVSQDNNFVLNKTGTYTLWTVKANFLINFEAIYS